MKKIVRFFGSQKQVTISQDADHDPSWYCENTREWGFFDNDRNVFIPDRSPHVDYSQTGM